MSETVDDLLARSPEEFRTRAIQALVPEGTSWRFSADDTGYVVTFDDPKDNDPTKAEIDAKALELKTEFTANQFQRDRIYPDLGEQLDLLFHDMTAGKGTKDGEWYKAVKKVKSDNPKPS